MRAGATGAGADGRLTRPRADPMRRVRVTQASDYDLVSELIDPDAEPLAPAARRVSLRVVGRA